jgi:hypothetical protein
MSSVGKEDYLRSPGRFTKNSPHCSANISSLTSCESLVSRTLGLYRAAQLGRHIALPSVDSQRTFLQQDLGLKPRTGLARRLGGLT